MGHENYLQSIKFSYLTYKALIAFGKWVTCAWLEKTYKKEPLIDKTLGSQGSVKRMKERESDTEIATYIINY